MATAMMADLGRLFFLVAPFTILPLVAVGLFGPEPVTDLAQVSGRQLLIGLVLPSIIAWFGQLAATHLVLNIERTPRDSLGAAVASFPLFVLAQLVMSVPVGLGLALLLVPGLWLFGRLLFLAGAVALVEPAAPLPLLQRCWQLSAGNGLPIALFIMLGLFAVIGIGLMAEGAGAALDVVARFAGLTGVGRFLHALMPAIGSCFATIGLGAASAVAYRRLASNLT